MNTQQPNEPSRISQWVIAKMPGGAIGVIPRKAWPIRNAEYISSHRTRWAAQEALVKIADKL